MDFHLATPHGDVYLFSTEDGRTVQIPAEPAPQPKPALEVTEIQL